MTMKRNYWKYALATLIYAGSLYALPPQVEADRLGLAAKTAIDAKDYATALEKLAAMQKLGVKLPDTFYYHTGVALLETGQYYRSLEMFDKYLSLGEKGKFYKEALEKYNLAEEMTKENTFIDTKYHLMWQDNAINTKTFTWDEAKQYCENLNYAGYTDWHLPSTSQLKALFHLRSSLKHIYNMKNPYFWSSYANQTISFEDGSSFYPKDGVTYCARCIRDNRNYLEKQEDCWNYYDKRIESKKSYAVYLNDKHLKMLGEYDTQAQGDKAQEKINEAYRDYSNELSARHSGCDSIEDFKYLEL